jgi:uncharacterized protein YfeS
MTQVWGNATWHMIHTLTYKLKDEHTNKALELFELLYQICVNVPCPYCMEHARKTLANVNKSRIRTKEDLIKVFFDFHNMVNTRLHKKMFTMDQFNDKYSKSQTRDVLNHFISVFSVSVKNDRAMAQNWSRRRLLTTFTSFIITNKHLFNG